MMGWLRNRRSSSAESASPSSRALAGELQSPTAGAGPLPAANPSYRRYTLLGMLILGLGLGGFIVWAALAPLSGAVVASGEVVLQGYRTTIQHLDGGIVESIPIEEGARVRQGEVLFRINATRAESDLAVVESRLHTALARRARLQAERDGDGGIDFPAALTQTAETAEVEEIITNQRAIFSARREALRTDLSRREQRIAELEEQIRGLQARLDAVDAQIASFETEVEERRGLVADQLASKEALRTAQRRLNELRGERGRLRSEIAGTRAQIATARMERTLRRQEYDQEVASGLGEAQSEILDARARAVGLRERLERTVVEAPMDGFVTGLQVHAEGSVISPGGRVMDLVPAQRQLLVDVQVPPDRIDDISVDQETDLSFPALDSLFADNIKGRVASISADALTNEQNGDRYFLARIRVTRDTVDRLMEQDFRLTPGMPAQAYINTGSRTMLEYLIKPFSEMLSRAFREG